MPRVDERHLPVLSEVARLVAMGGATTRAELAAATGMSRAALAQRVDLLISRGVLTEGERVAASRGRPALTLRLDPGTGVVCAADLGATRCRLALANLGGEVLAETEEALDIADGPATVLGRVDELIGLLLRRIGRPRRDVRAITVGVPGPVDYATGTPVRPPIMPGWDGYRVPDFFADSYQAPVLVDNDVNMMALGEFGRRTGVAHLLYVKIGTGIGCGIVSGGVLHRGGVGAAGDIGHIRVPGHEDVPCHCGNTGCVEAVASGRALMAALRRSGLDVTSAGDVIRLAAEGNLVARRQVRLAGRWLGEVLAAVVSFYNPEIIVVGGTLAALHEDLLAEIRAVVYRRALPLATRALTIERTALGNHAATEGGCRLALAHLLSPAGLAALLRNLPRS